MSKLLLKIKEMGLNQRKNTIVKIMLLALCITIFASGYMCLAYSEDLNKGLSNNLIRLHVIANSDSPEDQALKRDVRDVILNYMKDKYTVTKNVEETKLLIKENLNEIQGLAAKEIQRQEKNYSVDAMFGSYPFPTKVYGDITLPAGNYEALRVVIGKGEGANWWCVLFPPLCFVDATHGTIPDSVK